MSLSTVKLLNRLTCHVKPGKLCLYFSLLLLSKVQISIAQQPVFQWAKAFNANNIYIYSDNSNGRSVGVDGQGNVYSAGLFQHTLDFDPGPGVYNLSAAGLFETAIYISKLDANGNFVWAIQIPEEVDWGNIEIKVTSDGTIYLASDLRHAADMDPGPGVQIMTPIGGKDAFVIKFDTNGNFIWAKQFGGPGDTVPHSDILDVDQDNNVIICGGFNNTVDFDPGPGTYNLTSTAHIQAFIVKLDINGNLIWAKQFGNSPVVYSGSTINDLKCDRDGNIFTTGTFAGTCDFDPGAAVYSLTATATNDGFISKLDPDGNFIWAKGIDNTNTTYNNWILHPTGIDIDSMNNVITTGAFIGQYDFDPAVGVYNVATAGGTFDCYILKLDPQGQFLWVKTIGNNIDHEIANDIAVDANNNIYFIGSFGTSVDFDPGPGTYVINSPYPGASAIVKLNSNGNFVFAAPYQSIFYGSTNFRRMVVDNAENIYVTGAVSGTG
jgi:hypothetical protein